MTNAHVVEDCYKTVVYIDNMPELLTKNYVSAWEEWPTGGYIDERRLNEKIDIAVLWNYKISRKYRPLFFSKELPKVGETVISGGFPLERYYNSSEIKIKKGDVVSTKGPKDDKRLFQHTVPINPGDSGGPVLDKSGNVVGVTRSKVVGDDVELVGFAIKSSVVIDWIERFYVRINERSSKGQNLASTITSLREGVFPINCYSADF